MLFLRKLIPLIKITDILGITLIIAYDNIVALITVLAIEIGKAYKLQSYLQFNLIFHRLSRKEISLSKSHWNQLRQLLVISIPIRQFVPSNQQNFGRRQLYL